MAEIEADRWVRNSLIIKQSGVTHGAPMLHRFETVYLMLIVHLFRPISQAWDAYLLYIYIYSIILCVKEKKEKSKRKKKI